MSTQPPRIAIIQGSTTRQFPIIPIDPRTQFNVRYLPHVGFPDPQPQSGKPDMDNYLPHRHEDQRAPLGLGRRFFYDHRFVWDMYNVNARWGQVTLGPLAQAATFTSAPATFKLWPGSGFYYSNVLAKLIMFGFGAANDDEPIHLWNGTDTWADGTLNADNAANLNTISGVSDATRVATRSTFACFNAVTAVGGDNTLLFYTTDGTTWARHTDGAAAENITAGTYSLDRAAFLQPRQDSGVGMLLCLYSSTTNAITYERFGTGATTGLTFSGTLTTPITESDGAPRGMITFPGADGVVDVWLSSNRGLWYVDGGVSGTTQALKHNYRKPGGSYTGRLAKSPRWLYGIDGEEVFRFRWTADDQQGYEVQYAGIGGQFTSNLTNPDLFTEGVPIDAYGDCTAIWADPDAPIINVAKGGLAASRNARIYQYNELTGVWTCDYQVATAQRAIQGGITSTADSTIRRHIAQESAAGGDQDPQFFDAPNSNPFIDTGYKFAASGVLELSDFDGHTHTLPKGFYRTTITARNLTGVTSADERVDIQHSIDGAAYDSAQTVGDATSFVFGVWTDGSATAVGSSGIYLQRKLTLKRGTTNSKSPKGLAICTEYEVLGLKADNTPIRTFQFRISLNPEDYVGAPANGSGSPDQTVTLLESMYANRPLLKLAFGNYLKQGAEAKVRLVSMEEMRVTDTATGGSGDSTDGPGYILCTFSERI